MGLVHLYTEMGDSLSLQVQLGNEKLEIKCRYVFSHGHILRGDLFFSSFIFLSSLEREGRSWFYFIFLYCNFYGIVKCSNKSSCSCLIVSCVQHMYPDCLVLVAVFVHIPLFLTEWKHKNGPYTCLYYNDFLH